MCKNCLIMEIRKLIAIVLIINLVTIAAGQEINLQAVDTVSDTSSSTELSPFGTSLSDDSSIDPDSGTGLSNGIESAVDDTLRKELYYRHSSMGGRGVPAVSNMHSSDTTVKRKLLPPPVILPETADDSQTDSSVVQSYRMGKTEKRILLITGAILVTGGLVLLLAKTIGNKEKTTEDTGFPEPPRPPQY